MTEQIELGNTHYTDTTNERPAGFPQWASWIASDTDSEPLVFRKFDELAALNALYLQSEMLDIERQLRYLDQEDMRRPNIDSVNAARQWEVLVAQSSPITVPDTDPTNIDTKVSTRARMRMELIVRLRKSIKEYHEALALLSKIAHLQTPSERVLGALRQMFTQDGYPILDGQAREYLDATDLVALKSPAQDPLSNYLRKARAVKKAETVTDGLPRIGRFEEQQIALWVNTITILVATVFLIGPIIALYFTQSPPAKLALIAIFTAGFAGSVSLITSARRAEIFFGTATYAAVLVVFVSNGDLSSSQQCVTH